MAVVERYEGLEATADNLRRLLGDDAARALSQACGGRRLYVPKSPGPNHPITVILGQDKADQLAGAFHGVGIDVPMMPETQAQIRKLDALGWTRAAIAREVRVTERWVYKTLSRPENSETPQGRLFD
jgi:hypothetical protein